MGPRGRRPDDLIEPDETLRDDRGAGGGDPVPGFGRGFVHHRRDFAGRGRRPRMSNSPRHLRPSRASSSPKPSIETDRKGRG